MKYVDWTKQLEIKESYVEDVWVRQQFFVYEDLELAKSKGLTLDSVPVSCIAGFGILTIFVFSDKI